MNVDYAEPTSGGQPASRSFGRPSWRARSCCSVPFPRRRRRSRRKRPSADKTLVAWVSPANLNQQGGSVLTIQSGDRFDAIVFGERARGKWMAGSNFFQPHAGGPERQRRRDRRARRAGPDRDRVRRRRHPHLPQRRGVRGVQDAERGPAECREPHRGVRAAARGGGDGNAVGRVDRRCAHLRAGA